jgi:hypothetical protein
MAFSTVDEQYSPSMPVDQPDEVLGAAALLPKQETMQQTQTRYDIKRL